MDKNIFGDTKILVFIFGLVVIVLKKTMAGFPTLFYYSSKIDYFSVKWTFLANFGLKNSDYCTPYTSVFLYICHRLK